MKHLAMKPWAWAALAALGLAGAQAWAAPSHDALARDVERAESVRAVKNLQYAYAQYAQFGLWDEMGSLFAGKGVLDAGDDHVQGGKAIAAYFTRHYGAGRQGLEPGAIHTELIASPVVNLSADGKTAQARWDRMVLMSDAKGHASLEGGILENDYVREGGVWKIAHLHFYPQYEGPYETGWTNVGGKDLPIVPYHYDGDTAGLPIPAPVGPPPASKASLAQLEERIRVLDDEAEVRNLQAAYNYYVDRKMWNDVTDLFAGDGVVEIGGVGVYAGKGGVRKAMERMGPAGLTHGQLNDHLLFDDIAEILPGGREARMRGFELAMVGEADAGEAHWEVNVLAARFVKDGGVWKVREMRLFPLFRSDYHDGWGKSRLPEPKPPAALAPDRPMPAADRGGQDEVIPAFHAPNPVTRLEVQAPPGKRFVAVADLTGVIAAAPSRPPAGAAEARLAEDARRLAVATAYDGAENLNSAYGHLIDDFKWKDMAKLFGKHGAKEVPFAGYYAGYERIAQSVFLEYGDTQVTGRAGIAFHWLIQPVILVAADGRSANGRSYLFHPDTAKAPGSADIFGAMYPAQQFVLEDGVWRIWNLSLDEPYFSMPGRWAGGWSSKPAPRNGAAPAPPPLASLTPRPGAPVRYIGAGLVNKFEPDVRITDLGVREEHYQGGTGETWQWPQILPMWWNYRNPVSGRTPENFLPDCIPCDYKPDLSMTAHGYLLPPTGPQTAP
ncbi:MAG: nuclear transport factor 2 family protein [Caulobacteraceae bacterium]